MTLFRLLTYLMVGCVVIAACGSGQGGIVAGKAWARPSSVGANAAVYFELRNDSGMNDTLISAHSATARVIEIHQSTALGIDELDGMIEGGQEDHSMGDMASEEVMQMVPEPRLPIDSGESLVFDPGGYHLMLVDLQSNLEEGNKFQVILTFEGAGEVEMMVSVESR